MAFFGNKRKDFSIQPPKQQVDGTPFFVTDSANIDFTLLNLNLTANLTQLLPTSGTYGDATHIPILQIDQFGRVTGVTTTTFSASGIALETNGDPNDSQVILNLTSGTGIQVVDEGGGVIKFNYTGTSGNTYTVNNGLSPQTTPTANANNFQLGGALTKQTIITADSSNTLTISSTTVTPLHVSTAGTSQSAINLTSTNGVAILALSDNSVGMQVTSGQGNYAASLRTYHLTTNNTVLPIIEALAFTGGFPTQDGFGASIDFRLLTTDFGTDNISNKLISKWSTADNATRTSQFEITSVNNGAAESTIFTLKGTGQLQLNNYTGSTFDNAATKLLGVDVSGNVITTTGGGGGGTVTGVTATSPITSSEGTAPVISTSMATNKLIGRYSPSTGVMEEVIVGDGLNLTAGGQLNNTATPTPLGYYLSISDSTDQTNPTANTPRAVKFNTTDLANGFSLQTETAVFTGTINNGGAGAGTILNVTGVASGTLKVGMVLTGGSITAGTFISAFTSGTGGIGTYEVSVSQNRASATYTGTMTSQIVCANTGVYNIQFSSQMDKSDAGVDYVNFWLRKNGADLPESSGVISLQGNAPAYMMAAWNYLVQLVAGDVIELYWGSADVNMEIIHEPAQTSPFAHPAIQSTILTITQQSGIMAGTGMTALTTTGTSGASTYNSLTGVLNVPIYGGGGNSIGQLTSPGDVTTVAATAPSQGLTATLDANYKAGSFGVTFDGGGALITSGKIAYVRVPYKGTITGWQLVADQSGSCSIAVKQGLFSPFPPTTTILTAALSGTQTSSATGLSLAVIAGDWFSFTITGTSAVTLVNLSISITKII